MSGCGCGCDTQQQSGPYSKGKDLVEFVSNAHDGAVKDRAIGGSGLETTCQGCGAAFTLETFVGECPKCHGVHAVAPVNPVAEAIQFAGKDFTLTK